MMNIGQCSWKRASKDDLRSIACYECLRGTRRNPCVTC